jgi:hypothetical protein
VNSVLATIYRHGRLPRPPRPEGPMDTSTSLSLSKKRCAASGVQNQIAITISILSLFSPHPLSNSLRPSGHTLKAFYQKMPGYGAPISTR